ncbi:MAG TPA: hypothetical protein VFQ61_14735, partial [Polyangiaceae bacterium]|nr:hypothetical protein [Polyangiaceae bacterium]
MIRIEHVTCVRMGSVALSLWATLACSAGSDLEPSERVGESGSLAAVESAVCRNGAPAPPRSVLDRAHIAEVEIRTSGPDWEALRYEGKSLFDNFIDDRRKLDPFPYRTYAAEVIVDGVRYSNTGLRKTGFLGNLSAIKPSLVVEFGLGPHTPTLGRLREMVLNNDLEDASQVR